ncbi:LCP family protein [Streptomyces sp. NPDC088116]|uniref:LCP family protein n=1 Tax=Streptomyces sp. NPDC088116 TaxID=3365825 RepID=UPI0037FDF0F8
MAGSHETMSTRGGSARHGTGGRTVAARSRRRGQSRARPGLAIGTVLLVLVSAGVGWVYLRLSGNIDTFSTYGLSDNRPSGSSKGQNVLVIGSDARTGGNSALGGGDKNDIGRSDTAFLLHVYADRKHAVAVSIPRDTLLEIPPCKLPDGSWTTARSDAMFNSAFSVGQTAKGNPACTQNTVEKLTGLRVDHTVVVDFKGFSELTEVVGGVGVCLPQDVYQKDLNPNRTTRGKLIFAKGPQTLSGQKALDYVRIRHGIGDGSDIGRIKRQQAFVAALLKKVKGEGLTPTKLLPLADAATRSMTVDPGLGSADKLLSFAMSLKDIDLHNTKFVTVPWRYEGSRIAIVEPDASALWSALKADRTIGGTEAGGQKGGTGTPSASPTPTSGSDESMSGAGISVAVHNGTRVTGLAARAAGVLTEHGFTVTDTATASAQDYGTTLIEYGPGQEAGARAVARLFPDARLLAVSAASTAGIDVILGTSYEGDSPDSHDSPSSGATGSEGPGSEGPGSEGSGSQGSGATGSVPSDVTDGARSADDDPCSDLSYG